MEVELQTTLALILQQLADFFGMSIETITANAPEWLAKYGQYCVWGDIIEYLGLGVLFALMAYVAILFVLDYIIETKRTLPYVVTGILVAIVYLIVAIAIPLVRCNAAPEIYGLMNLIELVKS